MANMPKRRRAQPKVDSRFSQRPTKRSDLGRLILIYLTAARLPLGVFPTYRLLAAYNLEGPFWPLVEAIKVCRLLLHQELL